MLNFIPQDQTSTDYHIPSSPKMSEIKPVDFLLGIAKRIKTENESDRAKEKARTIIQMCRRHRGQTAGDAFGAWNQSGVWLESPAFQKLHNVPMFQQLVLGAEANFAQADIRLEIKANSHTFVNRSVEKIATDIYEILDERQWTETAKQDAFYSSALKNNTFYFSRFNKDKGVEVPVPKFEDTAYEMGGLGICTECNEPSEMSGVNANACPNCGNDSFTLIDDPQTVQDQLVSGFETTKAGEVEMIIASGLEVSMDPNGKPADIKSCKWLEYRVPVQKEELKRLYPHLKLEGSVEWSYQTRLKKAFLQFKNGEASPMTEREKTEYELRNIFLDVTEYEGYCAPEDMRIGRETVLARGEKLADKFPDGLVIGIVCQEIAFIAPENKNKRVSSSLWVTDGSSPEGIGVKSGLALQRTLNQLENIITQGVMRSLNGSVVYDPNALTGSQLEGSNMNIPLKTDFAIGSRSIKDFVFPISVQGLSEAVLLYQDRIKQTMQEVMGIPDVMLGQDTSTDKTYGGQALRSRNALGLMTPKTQSTARAKELWLGHQLDLIQTYYSPEALRQFGARSGSEWLDDEIDAFFDADLEDAITISYIPGTEVPESRFEKQMRLREDILSGVLPPTVEGIARLAKESNYDAPDVNNFDSNLRLAEKRFLFVKKEVEGADEMFLAFEQELIDPATGYRAFNPISMQPIPNPIVAQLLARPELTIYEFSEDPGQQAEFWSQKVRDLAGAPNGSSPALLAMCDAMVKRHHEAGFQQMTLQQVQEGTAMAAGQAPAAIGQKMLGDGEEEKKPNKPAKK